LIYFGIIIGGAIFISLLTKAIQIIKEYERRVVLTSGKYNYTLNPDLLIIVPIIQQIIKVDIRLKAADIPRQEVITKDNVSVEVNAVICFKVKKKRKCSF